MLANVYLRCIFRQAPSERARLYFLLAWFHAIVQERLRYVPLGWSKRYEFSESDLRVACDTLDTWLDAVAQVRVSTTRLSNASVTFYRLSSKERLFSWLSFSFFYVGSYQSASK